MLRIHSAAVIGAGTMGSAIAAHLANAGITCLLLDIVPENVSVDAGPEERSQVAIDAIQRMAKHKPAPLYNPADADLLSPGNLEDDFDKLKNVQWVIEAAPEVLKIKQDLFKRLSDIHQPGQLFSSNTSGISLSDMISDCTDDCRKHCFISHFFNPPRYMHLLEIVAGPETDTALFNGFMAFAEHSLGKGIVVAKDTPNFIANRIGAFDMCKGLELMQELSLSVEEVDALAGPLIGRPKSALCRLLDLVGIDVIGHVNANIFNGAPDDEERAIFAEHKLLKNMLDKKLLGDKSNAGFYRKTNDDNGKRVIEALQLKDFSYQPVQKITSDTLDSVKHIEDIGERLRAFIEDNSTHGQFVWQLLSASLCYAARRIPEIADDVEAIDHAMCWGFNWEYGPFQLWDAIGIDYICTRLEAEQRAIPALVEKLRNSGQQRFYTSARNTVRDPRLSSARSCSVIKDDADTTLYDIGDDLAALEIHSFNNTLSINVLAGIREAVSYAEVHCHGLLLCARGSNFSFGANLKEMLSVVENKGFNAVEEMISNFQLTSMMLKHCRIPTVAAAQGLALGGGCEFVIHCDRIHSAPELYIGLVEAGVGLLPAGGGTKEMAVRASDWAGDTDTSLFPQINKAMEQIGMAQMSASAVDARRMGYLRSTDQLSMNKLFLFHDARAHLGQLCIQHYRPSDRRPVRVMGRGGIGEFTARLHNMREADYISEHDQFILNKIAYVICGGDVATNSLVSHQYLLDLERECFLQLLGTEKSQARVQHTMNTGKPLRN